MGVGAFLFHCAWNSWWLLHGRLPESIALGIFGAPAPTTGVKRALLALVNGDVSGSLWWNPIALPLLLLSSHGLWRLCRLIIGRGPSFEQRWVRLWFGVLTFGWPWKLSQGAVAW